MNKLKVLVSLIVMALCSSFAFAAGNPVEGKKYVADVMGIEAMSIEFVTYSKCVISVMEGSGSSETKEGTYTVSGNTVTVTADDEPLPFTYDKKNDALALTDPDSGFTFQLKVKKSGAAAANPNAKYPKKLDGKTFAGEMMGIEFMVIDFKAKGICFAKVANDFNGSSVQYQTIEGTYTYDNSNGDMTITMEGDTQNFKYNKAKNAIVFKIDDNMSLELFEKK